MFHSLAIRVARPDDAARMQQIAQAAYAHYRSRMSCDPAPMHADFAHHIAADMVFVAGGKMIDGYAVLIKQDDGWLLDNIAVDPNGQKTGIGRALVAHCERALEDLNIAKYSLYTNIAMRESLAWWLSIGFVETDRRLESGFHRIYMEKRLC